MDSLVARGEKSFRRNEEMNVSISPLGTPSRIGTSQQPPTNRHHETSDAIRTAAAAIRAYHRTALPRLLPHTMSSLLHSRLFRNSLHYHAVISPYRLISLFIPPVFSLCVSHLLLYFLWHLYCVFRPFLLPPWSRFSLFRSLSPTFLFVFYIFILPSFSSCILSPFTRTFLFVRRFLFIWSIIFYLSPFSSPFLPASSIFLSFQYRIYFYILFTPLTLLFPVFMRCY